MVERLEVMVQFMTGNVLTSCDVSKLRGGGGGIQVVMCRVRSRMVRKGGNGWALGVSNLCSTLSREISSRRK